MVSKTAVLLTEWVFESDLVSKMPHLLTEWVFEGDLVSKMADLLTGKNIRCATTGLLRKHCASEGATITPTRLASRGRECPRGSVVSSVFASYRAGLTSATGSQDRLGKRERADYQGNCRKPPLPPSGLFGLRPRRSRHSRGTGRWVRRACYTRGLRGTKR